MANCSRLKSDRMRLIEDGLRRVQALDAKLTEGKYKTILVQSQLDDLKLELTQEA